MRRLRKVCINTCHILGDGDKMTRDNGITRKEGWGVKVNEYLALGAGRKNRKSKYRLEVEFRIQENDRGNSKITNSYYGVTHIFSYTTHTLIYKMRR